MQQRLVLLHPNQVCLLWSQNRWQARLHVVGLDLRDVASVEAFCQFMAATFESGVDIVVNNACQTVRRCRRVRTRLEKDTLLLPAEMDLKKETLLLPAEMDSKRRPFFCQPKWTRKRRPFFCQPKWTGAPRYLRALDVGYTPCPTAVQKLRIVTCGIPGGR